MFYSSVPEHVAIFLFLKSNAAFVCVSRSIPTITSKVETKNYMFFVLNKLLVHFL